MGKRWDRTKAWWMRHVRDRAYAPTLLDRCKGVADNQASRIIQLRETERELRKEAGRLIAKATTMEARTVMIQDRFQQLMNKAIAHTGVNVGRSVFLFVDREYTEKMVMTQPEVKITAMSPVQAISHRQARPSTEKVRLSPMKIEVSLELDKEADLPAEWLAWKLLRMVHERVTAEFAKTSILEGHAFEKFKRFLSGD